MTKEEKKRLKEGRKAAEKRAKLIRKEEIKKEKEARKEAKRREKAEKKLKNNKQTATDIVAEEETKQAEVVVEKEEKVVENDNVVEETTEENAENGKKISQKRNYHVSLREDGKWQVKFAKGARALKLFDTQAEAIAFAKEKAENQDGNITIHKKDGKIRKQNYSKK